jgi:hypothetical protein
MADQAPVANNPLFELSANKVKNPRPKGGGPNPVKNPKTKSAMRPPVSSKKAVCYLHSVQI